MVRLIHLIVKILIKILVNKFLVRHDKRMERVMNIQEDYAVQMRGITKRFGSFTALAHVDINIKKGTIHSILGENGAGKTTLMNILYGLCKADEGEIFLNGKKVDIKNPNVAIENGIGMVHQHFMLVENFTIAQNIILGKEETKGLGVIDIDKANKKILEIIEKYGLEVEPNELIEDVSVGMQQKVEIIKALYRGADILILDEPTAVLTPQEIVELLNIMNKLIEDGKTIIIITHKLKEIKQSAEECTILRRGKYIDTVNVADVNEEELAKKMVGRSVNLVADKSPAQVGDVVFEIKNLFVKNEKELYAVKDLSLEIRKGEIMGIAGIDGNGQKELVEAITNLRPAEKGQIIINGVEIQNTSPNNVIKNKVATIHEDRQKVGLVLDFTVAENIIIENFKSPKYSKNGIILKDKIINKAKELIKKFDIRPSDSEELAVKGLSGGNQQKVIIAREVENNPDLLIAVQPTRGLDVGAIEFIHKTLIEERDKGKAILLISYELDEVMNLSDTLAVIYDGCIVNTFKQGTIDENTIGLLMAGGKVSEQNI